MERFHGNVGSLERALEQAPEVFQTVCMDTPLDVSLRMVNHLMVEFSVQANVGHERIRIDWSPFLDVLRDVTLQFGLLAIRNGKHANLSTTLQDAERGGFVF